MNRSLPNDSEESRQSRVFELLENPSTYGAKRKIERIDTLGAAVFIADDFVYKVKKAIKTPYIDFSTLELRHRACEAEIVVNHANAPQLYLGVLPIFETDGRLKLGEEKPDAEPGRIVEWAVWMRRFDPDDAFDRMAGRGELHAPEIDSLARAIQRSHARAPICDGEAAISDLRRHMEGSLAQLVDFPEILPARDAADFAARARLSFEQAQSLMRARGALGQIRRCHGDLHLGNIAWIGGDAVLFDAIEFDETIATIDRLYDLAFPVMDLWERGQSALANRLFNRYLELCPDKALQIEGLAAFGLFLSLRAAVRAKIFAERAVSSRDSAAASKLAAAARSYFDAACAFLAPREGPGAMLVAVGGLSGAGKTTLARAIADRIGAPPGAIVLRSDFIRKELCGAQETERLPQAGYEAAVSARVVARMEALARLALATGHAVILDATHRGPGEQLGARSLAARLGVPFRGLWLESPAATRAARVAARSHDASDATAEIALAQQSPDLAPDWLRLEASGAPAEIARQAFEACKRPM